ncbi:MAG: hypothetical protein IKN25_01605 [Spirochaetales bacterium]|nr:hypothetical protein [Spirochaetales bacterium]
MKKLLITIMIMIVGAVSIFAATAEDMEQALVMMKEFRLNVPGCPTLEQVCDKQLVNVKWDNPGGGDQFYCYAKVNGIQPINREVFSVVFRYDIEHKKVEPFSVRVGSKLYVKMDQMQRYLIRFYATESEEVRNIMMRLK